MSFLIHAFQPFSTKFAYTSHSWLETGKTYSAQYNSWKLVGHSYTLSLIGFPLEMYNKILPTKLDLLDHIATKMGWKMTSDRALF